MVVVVIIGILVAIAIPVYGGIQGRANASAARANLRTVDGAIAIIASEVNKAVADITDHADYADADDIKAEVTVMT